jgi:hypothetical protein
MVYGLTRDDVEDLGIRFSEGDKINRLIVMSYTLIVIFLLYIGITIYFIM